MKRAISAFIGLLFLATLSFLPMMNVLAATSAINLIANPSAETINPSNTSAPLDWDQGSWGTNTAGFAYSATSAEDGTHSLSVNMTKYTSGDAKWYFAPVAVTAGTTYNFSDYYQSSVATDVVAQFDDGNGNYVYQDLGMAAASTTWKQYTASIVIPAGEKNVTVFHLIDSVGTLQTDNFSLTAATTVVTSTPTVAITTPTANSSASGTISLSATANDTNGIKQVQYQLDGSNIGSALTTAPYTLSWNSTTVANGTHTITAIASNTEGVSTTSAAVSITVTNASTTSTNLITNPSLETASTTSASTPLDWATDSWGTNSPTFTYLSTGHTGSHSVKVQMNSYTSGDAKWYFDPITLTAGTTYNFSDYYQSSVATDVVAQFENSSGDYEYQDLGEAAASTTWTQYNGSFTVPSGYTTVTVLHVITAVGTLETDDYSLMAAASAPIVSVTSPAANASISGTVSLTASASDKVGIKQVQYQLDGSNIGSALTTAPYTLSWNSTTVANGTHTITAIASNDSGITTTSTADTIKVANTTTTSTNMIANPSVETASASNASLPADWTTDNWGTNTATFSYLNTGHTGSHSLSVNMTSYTSGDAKWSFTPVSFTPDTQYQYSEWYESNVNTQVDAVFTLSNGTIDYEIIGLPGSSTSWKQFTTDFSVPQGTQNITIYHLLQSVGYLTTDDFSMAPYTPVGFTRPIVTLTFDDGYDNDYTQGLPLLQKYGFTSTQFVITDLVNTSGYMTSAQVKSFYQAGDEIASHTVTHDDMTQETSAQLTTELSQSQKSLESWTGATSIPDIAYPYGLYNSTVTAQTMKYYAAARGVEDGLNSKDNFNPYDIKVQNIYNTTTTAQVADWVKQAQLTDTWLVLVYHSIDPSTTDTSIYNATPTQLDAQLSAIKSSGVTVETMHNALNEVESQL